MRLQLHDYVSKPEKYLFLIGWQLCVKNLTRQFNCAIKLQNSFSCVLFTVCYKNLAETTIASILFSVFKWFLLRFRTGRLSFCAPPRSRGIWHGTGGLKKVVPLLHRADTKELHRWPAVVLKAPASLPSDAFLPARHDWRVWRREPRWIHPASSSSSSYPAQVTSALAYRHFPPPVSEDDTWRARSCSHVLLGGDNRSPDAAVGLFPER